MTSYAAECAASCGIPPALVHRMRYLVKHLNSGKPINSASVLRVHDEQPVQSVNGSNTENTAVEYKSSILDDILSRCYVKFHELEQTDDASSSNFSDVDYSATLSRWSLADKFGFIDKFIQKYESSFQDIALQYLLSQDAQAAT